MDVLANWIWQGCAVTAFATLLVKAAPRLSATTRYRIWWTTFLVLLALPFLPQVAAWALPDDSLLAGPPTTVGSAAISVELPAVPWWPSALLIVAWMAWVGRSVWRTAVSLITLRTAKRQAIAFPEARECRLPNWLALRMSGRQARLVVSDRVRSAAVLGLGSPAIAVAPAVLDELSDSELDQVLVHEWAHVQRFDDIARLIQVLVHALAGLHPAIWWIERQLNVTREDACDDWAINVTGSARNYAACLAKLASIPSATSEPLLVPAALSMFLSGRVVRLLDRHRNTSTRRTIATPVLVAMTLAAVATIAASIEVVASTPAQSRVLMNVKGPVIVERPTVPLVAAAPAGGQAEAGAVPRPRGATARAARASQPRPMNRVQGRAEAPAPDAERIDTRSTTTTPDRIAHAPGVEAANVASLPGVIAAVPEPPSATEQRSAAEASPSQKQQTPWGAAADAGVSVGRGSQKAAVRTAGFFTRFSKAIANSF